MKQVCSQIKQGSHKSNFQPNFLHYMICNVDDRMAQYDMWIELNTLKQ